ncbi:MAG: MarR family transcriptional regulator [Phycisphaerae bacterium]|nr:MarR family transcriptional regulator [Phycisphaerae bacterium]
MPEYQQAQQVQEFTNEIFEISKASWTAQNRRRGKTQHELTEAEFLALDILAKAGRSLNVGEIQREIGVLPAQMSRIIRALESKGDKPLVTCRINPGDKRKIDVELSPAGVEAHHAYRQVKLGTIQQMLEGLDEKDRNELMRLLRIVRQNIRKSLPENVL